MKAYSWDAADYASHSASQFRWAQELIEKLQLAGNEAVLDIGCGDGRVTAEIARRLPHGSALGIDNSPSMVAFATDKLSASPQNNLSFRHLDATRLDYRDAFDVVFSNAAMHWIQDHPSVLAGIKRGLKPGGRMLLQMGGSGNAAGVINCFDGLITSSPWRRFFDKFHSPYWFYGPDAYRGWLKDAGLSEVRMELIPKDMQHAGRDGLAGWIRTTWMPYVSRVPESSRHRFIDALVERYLGEHGMDEDGVVHVGMVRLEVEAAKPAN
jgi:trans-aconitate 2-methyltransferase